LQQQDFFNSLKKQNIKKIKCSRAHGKGRAGHIRGYIILRLGNLGDY
jgi:hypothetical protein